MKQVFTLIIFLSLLTTIPIGAQNRPNDRPDKAKREEMMRELQMHRQHYYTQTIGLTQEEADKFFPLYEEMTKKKYDLQHRIHEKFFELDNLGDDVSDSKYTEVAKFINDINQQEWEITNSYFLKFQQILSPEKLYRYERAEILFARDMLRDKRKPDERK